MAAEASSKSVDSTKEGSIMLLLTMMTDEVPTLMAILEEQICLLTTIVRRQISDPPSLPPGPMVLLQWGMEIHVLHLLRELLLR